jgi:hypothetical protein
MQTKDTNQQNDNSKYHIYLIYLELLSIFVIFSSLLLSLIIPINKYFFYGGLFSLSFFILLNIFRTNNSYNKVGRTRTLGLACLKFNYVACSCCLIGIFFMIEGFLGFYEFIIQMTTILVICMLGYLFKTKEVLYQIDFKKYLIAIAVIVLCFLFRIDIFCLIHNVPKNSNLAMAYKEFLENPYSVEKYRKLQMLKNSM